MPVIAKAPPLPLAASPSEARALAAKLVEGHHPPLTWVYWYFPDEPTERDLDIRDSQGHHIREWDNKGFLVWHSPGDSPMSGEELLTDPAEIELITSGKEG